MSGLLAGKVWLSALDPDLKPLAATLADIANDDGTSIYPSVAYIAWRLGRCERAVQVQLQKLRTMGVLVTVRQGGGRKRKKEAEPAWGCTTEYRLMECSLPGRATWQSTHYGKGATVAPLSSDNGAELLKQQRSLSQTTVKPTAPNPLVSTTVSKSNRQEPNGENASQGREEEWQGFLTWGEKKPIESLRAWWGLEELRTSPRVKTQMEEYLSKREQEVTAEAVGSR